MREGPRFAAADVAIDVAFVDVQLIGSEVDDEGLELVRPREAAAAPLFVLATASRQHALEAFDLGVVDYLSSVHRGARGAMPRAAARPASGLSRTPGHAVAHRRPQKRALVFIRLEEVWAFEAAERSPTSYLARRFDVDLSLRRRGFLRPDLLRVHRKWL